MGWGNEQRVKIILEGFTDTIQSRNIAKLNFILF